MRIAIDLNDVLRDYSRNFAKYYHQCYDHSYDFSDFEAWTNEMRLLFPFKSDSSYEQFAYVKYVYEIFGKCDACHPQLAPMLNNWLEHTIKDIDVDEEIEVIIVSTMEYGLSLSATQFFISKLGCPVREFYFPKDSQTIWDRCDILITADPKMLDNKPEGKKTVKIKTEYNKECEGDFTFRTMKEFLSDENNTLKIIGKENE